MGYVAMFDTCWSCGKMFSFHPNKVPSLKINGIRQPVCRECIEKVNPLRVKNGLPPITYSPDAYDGADEQEINWNG